MARYKWSFDVSGVLTECKPIIDDGTSLDYGQQSGEVFYRAKLNGSLLFRFEFDYIMNAGYNAEHVVVLQRYDSGTDDFVEVWRGKFTLTDCTINYDTHTIDVTPETIDRYTAVLDNLEKEYNLVKLKAQIKPVNILIRPCLQIYKYGSSKIANFIGGNSWDSECDSSASVSDITDTFKFTELRDCIWFTGIVKNGVNAGKKVVYYGRFLFLGSDMVVPMDGRIYNSDGTYIEEEAAYNCIIHHDNGHKWFFSIQQDGTLDLAMACFYDDRSGSDNNESYTEGDIFEDTYLCWDRVFGRTICQTTADDVIIGGTTYTLYDISSSDMAGINLNYNKVMQKAFASIEPSIDTDTEPTTWPQDSLGRYFVKPANTPTKHYWAASPETWIDVAYWWWATAQEAEVEEKLTAIRKINDCYDYRSVIQKLLGKAGVYPNYIISYCLGGTNDYVGTRTDLRITPRSNVISSYYDTPAQNAPITLAKVLNMLKTVYQCYWYIDNSGNFHIEHISYFDNGYSTTEDEPELIVDLESELHTRTLNNKVFGQNQVKYDKQDMPEQYTFGWADSVTRPFIGYPINCLDKYVQQGNISEQNAADFDSDVDYVLSSPNDVSKDGFFLFALPTDGLGYSDTLKVENVLITDEVGDTFEVSIQNADAAFVKIHKTWWRYHLPCENINVNNEDTVALTTGNFKLQTLEFADTAMADIIGNVDNCNKIIRTQQGDGHVKTLSINLNSLATKADLLFNFVGRWYYLRGTALGATITISVNGESVTIDVSNNTFKYRYKEPIAALDFSGTDVVSVNFADCDNLNNLTSADEMFKNCAELLAVDFANKTFGAVTTANDMFAGCSQLTTLICPPTASWKADLDFTDCTNLTLESLNDLINDFLYSFDSGTHTITPNSTMWNGLSADVQTDLITKATAKGWQIGIPAQYSLSGTSTGSTVYATINGAPIEIEVVGGAWHYDYNIPITAISFLNDSTLTAIDFTSSDLLSGVTSLNDAFKGCSALTSVDFTGCDLSNVATAADCFSGCVALTSIVADSGVWKPDIDLSDTAMVYASMLSTIGILYTYATGTHTISFNSTIWDSLTQAQQQTIFDAADAKGWTTNAPMVVYVIRGTSTNVNGTETFNIQFIDDGALSPSAAETITCAVDGSGNFEIEYSRKKIYSLLNFAKDDLNLLTIDFSSADDFSRLQYASDTGNGMLRGCINLTSANFANQTFANTTVFTAMFNLCASLQSVNFQSATFANATAAEAMFENCTSLLSVIFQSATFENITNILRMFNGCTNLASVDLSVATFEKVTTTQQMFANCTNLTSVDLSSATFDKLQIAGGSAGNGMFNSCKKLQTLLLNQSMTLPQITNTQNMFRDCELLPSISIPNATFANVTALHNMFNGCKAMTSLRLDSATFAAATTANDFISNTNALTTIVLPNSSTWNVTLNLSYSPLTYASMVYVANWLKDRSGMSALTCTFKASAWNALSSAEQNTIDGILSGKNWNRAIA